MSQHTPCVVLLVQQAHPWWSAWDSSPLSTVTSYWNPALVTCPNNFHFPQDFPQLFRHFRDHPHINKTFLSPPLVLMDITHGSTKITSSVLQSWWLHRLLAAISTVKKYKELFKKKAVEGIICSKNKKEPTCCPGINWFFFFNNLFWLFFHNVFVHLIQVK